MEVGDGVVQPLIYALARRTRTGNRRRWIDTVGSQDGAARFGRGLCAGAGSVRAGSWIWKIGDETHATIGYRIETDGDVSGRLTLEFRVSGEPVHQTIWLERRPCRFGGGRWFAQCPQTGRGAAKLYLPLGGRRFLSRHAYRMGYRSQCEGPAGRAVLKRDRLAALLGLDHDESMKPKWMRWRTFDRALDRLDACDGIWKVEIARRFGMKF